MAGFPARPALGAAVLGTALGVGLVLSVLALGGTPAGGSRFILSASQTDVGVSFPSCARIHVSWNVTAGGPVSFGVWPPAALVASDCARSLPTNATPPPGYITMDAYPVCYESGFAGNCSFTADQQGYGFYAFGPWNGTGWAPLGGSQVSVDVSWS